MALVVVEEAHPRRAAVAVARQAVLGVVAEGLGLGRGDGVALLQVPGRVVDILSDIIVSIDLHFFSDTNVIVYD